MQITGVILAGGLSSRFGTDKAQALYCGRTFISLAYELLMTVCREVVISGTDHRFKAGGILCLPDIAPGGGPMAGIATAVKRLQAQWLLIVPCDMPLLIPSIVGAAVEAAKDGVSVTWKEASGKLQPFPLLLHRPHAERAIEQMGEAAGMSIKHLLKHLPYTALSIPESQLQLFSNINTQPEFEKLCHNHQ